ncbi:uncharacterized protein EI97DRAFT_439095 [Westerdykella ornata]|uniref:Chromo domain-containing protein n=1 Tax=Westerdykella ornata TaxID=318751 RepID=A0A6A6JW94_WESOR|nr:uncharacterized protein EI97DRAFT_439095 [Westerdykella ornata]KAF2280006.1 hypothetical protein EI97DRAFT_439095 [Westerdykella ornata]
MARLRQSAPTKRKRKSTDTKPNKRHRRVVPSSSASEYNSDSEGSENEHEEDANSKDEDNSQGGEIGEGYWKAKPILKERSGEYLIDWAGVDPKTKKPQLVQAWLKGKRKRSSVAGKTKSAQEPPGSREEDVQEAQISHSRHENLEAQELEDSELLDDVVTEPARNHPQRVHRASNSRQRTPHREVLDSSGSVLPADSDLLIGQSSRAEGSTPGTQPLIEDSDVEDGSASYLPSTTQASASGVSVSESSGNPFVSTAGNQSTTDSPEEAQKEIRSSAEVAHVHEEPARLEPNQTFLSSPHEFDSGDAPLQPPPSDSQVIAVFGIHTQTQPGSIEIPETPFQAEPESVSHPTGSGEELGASVNQSPPFDQTAFEEPSASFVPSLDQIAVDIHKDNSANLNITEESRSDRETLHIATAPQTELTTDPVIQEGVVNNSHLLPNSPDKTIASNTTTTTQEPGDSNNIIGHVKEVDQISSRDFGHHSQVCSSATNRGTGADSLGLQESNPLQEQQAQVVPSSPYLSTQESQIEDIRPTTELSYTAGRRPSTPPSRHDSSQESGKDGNSPIERTLDDFSILGPPPSRSLEELDSNLPPRPHTPVPTSSLSAIMSSEYPEEDFAARARREFASLREKKWGTPQRQRPDGTQGTLSPAMDGTRSPSTIPDRAPQGPAPPPLLTAALMNSTAVQIPEMPLDDAAAVVTERPSLAAPTTNQAPQSVMDSIIQPRKEADEPARQRWSPLPGSSDESASLAEEIRSDSGESYLEDDIHLADDRLCEHIVPLLMGGRQKDAYIKEIRLKKDPLESFAMDPQAFRDLGEVEEIFNRLRAVETHVDLLWAESASADVSPQRQAQWDVDSSVKFAFLSALLRRLKELDWHVIIVLKEGNERLFDILVKFLRGNLVNYTCPAKSQHADFSEVEGSVRVTLLSSDSSFIVSPPDVIISLDGASAAEIGKRNWSVNPDRKQIPLLQLVIPRSVSHIELSLSPKLTKRDRLHAVVACLSQLHKETGRPLVDTPHETEAADMIAHYLISTDIASQNDEGWPLPPIHSIKDVIEFTPQQYSSQLSQTRLASPTPSAPQATLKRPLVSNKSDITS